MVGNEEGDLRMRKRSLAHVAVALSMGVLIWGGCGLWKKYSANSAIKKVKTTLAEAQKQEADRYASEMYTSAESLIQEAEADVQAKSYDEALNKTNEAEAKAKQAMSLVAKNRQIIQGKREELTELDKSIQEVLQLAESAPSRAVAEAEIAQAREAYDAIQGEVRKQLTQRAQRAEDYDALIARLEEVAAQAGRAYDLTLAETAGALAQRIQNKVTTLEELEFATFLPESAEAVRRRYEEFRQAMETQAFGQAVATGNLLDATLDEQIPAARFARAEQTVEQADARLAEAAAMGGLEYALEQMRAGQQALSDAKARLDEKQYDQAYNMALQAIGSAEVALDEVKRRIESRIETLRDRIAEADESGAGKYAPEDLAESRAKLTQAFNLLTEQDFQSARAVQEEAAEAVERAFTAAKKGRAREKLERIAGVIARAERQGAGEYLPESLVEARGKLSEAQAIFERGDYVEVHPVADLAENLAHKTLGELRELAEERIQQAQDQITSAEEARAGEYAEELLAEARSRLNDAKVQLAAEEYRQSLQLSAESRKTANQAESQAYRLRTDETLQRVAAGRQLALDSGAKEHSSAQFLAAVQQEEIAGQKYATGSFKEALAAATQAEKGFEGARLSKIRRATEAVESAVAAQAEQYAPEGLARAQSLLAEAKLDMEAKAYSESNRKADEAAQQATQAEVQTWNKRGQEKIAEWEKAFEKAVADFAEQKAPELMAESKQAGVAAKAEFAVKNYRLSHEQAVSALEALERADAALAEQAQAAVEAMRARLTDLSALAVDETGRSQLSGVVAQMAACEKARESGDLRSVFTQAEQFQTAADQAEIQLKSHNLAAQRDRLLAQLQKAKEQGITLFVQESAQTIEQMLQQLDPIARTEDYGQAQQELAALEEQIQQFTPQAETALEKMIAEMQKQLNEARQAGALELIPEQYSAAVEAYKLVLNYPKGEGSNYHELYALTADAGGKSKTAFDQTNLAISTRNFKEVVQNYLKEMNSLLDSFSSVTDYNERFFIASASTRQVDVYRELQHDITATALRRRAELLLDKARELQPPAGQEATYRMALKTFEEMLTMADLFERFGQYEKYEKRLRDQYITQAFASLERVKSYNVEVQQMLAGEVRRPWYAKFNWKFWETFF